uniref:Eukaryotic translation initiation factor 1A domain containing n=1 Tax=Rattus norvegicus TaxID=10116 RepID=A0A8I5ZVW1_RAT
MSQASKRKHVVQEVLGEHMVPSDQQQIVKVLRTPGNNLHEVETAQGQRFLGRFETAVSLKVFSLLSNLALLLSQA